MNQYEIVQELCNKHGTNFAELERKLGFSNGYFKSMSRSKRGTMPYERSKAVADFFAVDVSMLLGEETSACSSVKVPVYASVSAGLPIEAHQNIIDYEEIPTELAKNGEYFALRIKGDSMSPRMLENDVVIVRKQSTAISGEIVIALIGDEEATIKKYIRNQSGIVLMPFNSLYEPFKYNNEEIETVPVKIIGKVIELRAKL